MEGSINAVQEPLQELIQSSTPRPFKGFGSFKVEAGEQLNRTTVTKLANVMGSPKRFLKEIKNETTPGLYLLNELEAKGKISASNIDYLLDCLADRAIGLFGTRDKIDAIFQANYISKDDYGENIENKHSCSVATRSSEFEGMLIKTPRRRKSTKEHREVLSPSQIINIKHKDDTCSTKMTIKYYGKVKKRPRMPAKKQLDLSSEDDEKNSWRDESENSDSSAIE